MRIPPKGSWWQRNWKWFVPTGCFTLILLTTAAVAVLVLAACAMMKSSGAYKIALARVQEDSSVIEELGAPITPGWYLTGNIQVSGTESSASIAFPVSGPKGSGKVIAEAVKVRDKWKLDYLAVDIGGKDKRIVIAEDAADPEGPMNEGYR